MTINDSNWKFLHDATGLSLPFNEMYFRYLGDLGYTGTLTDRIAKSGLGMNPSGLKNPSNNDIIGLERLFVNGEDGFLFDSMSDLTRLFTTVNGPPAVAANDDTVALMLDNSKWGGRTLAQMLAAQAELTTNGDFASGAGWGVGTGWAITGGQAVHTPTGGNDDLTSALAALTIGKYYAVTYTVTDRTLGITTFSLTGAGTSVGLNRSGNGTVTEYIQAVAAHTTFRVRASPSFDGRVDDLSIKEVPGNHALQAVGANEPAWKAGPKPYVQGDATSKALISPWVPTAAGALALAWRPSVIGQIGLGSKAVDDRAYIQVGAAGALAAGVGQQSGGIIVAGPNILNSDNTAVLTWSGTTVQLWSDGALIYSAAQVGGVNPAGFGAAICALNNGGAPANFSDGRIYAAMGISRVPTDAEIARITSQFQSRF